ncbi:hypothetical protein CEQ90_03855 [Lewinellaceae bacterium SD302]|nr:hypothetical protein CEQ90_03855 [Lewinellaceae bacterium SD302]
MTNRPMKYFILLLTLCSFSLSAQTITWDKAGETTKKSAQTSPAYNRAYNDLQVGNATYYADYLAGRPTAYGETYRPDQLTASHALLPLGTILTVTRLGDGRSVQVRVTDNSGHTDGSLVVLSRAAAQQLGMIEVGRTRVSVKRTGFSNWNPQPAQPAQRQLTARSVAPRPTTYQSAPATTAYRTPVTRPASGYYPPAPQTQANNGYVRPTTSGNSDFSDVNSRANDPVAYQPATYENRSVSQPTAYQPPVYNNASQTAKSPAVVRREVPVSNTPAYQPVSANAQPTAYARANVAPVNEVKVSANQVQRGYAIQLAAYGNLENAQRQVRSLQNQGVENIYVATVNRADGMTLNRVMVGPFTDAALAQRTADDLLSRKQINGIVTRLQ